MKFLFDLFPVLLFFVAYKFFGIFVATWVAVASSVAQIAWLKLRGRKVDGMMWLSFGIIVVLGGATLISHNITFIKWKLTVLYWLYASILLGSDWFYKKNLIRAMLGTQISLPDAIWRKLNLSWVSFFVFMGGLNLYVAYTFSTDIWVNFKLFGSLALMVVFIVVQSLVLNKYTETNTNE
ncbi:MAG: septation protein A [Betaproteobacteria bacterium]|nr:septation protein A [Betaproteobacteria bacterium]